VNTESKTIEELLLKLGPNQGIIGINEELGVYEGYDGCLECAFLQSPCDDEDWVASWKRSELTFNEKRILADEMILRWLKYRTQITPASSSHETVPS